jgi:hypothetical protein
VVVSVLARIIHTVGEALINAAALARCKNALSLMELFKQFVARELEVRVTSFPACNERIRQGTLWSYGS